MVGGCFIKGTVHKLLNSLVYLGQAVHKGTAWPGEHEIILDGRQPKSLPLKELMRNLPVEWEEQEAGRSSRRGYTPDKAHKNKFNDSKS